MVMEVFFPNRLTVLPQKQESLVLFHFCSTHLYFVDDLRVFSMGDLGSIEGALDVFQRLRRLASSRRLNPYKIRVVRGKLL